MKKQFTLFASFLLLFSMASAQQLQTLELSAVEDTIPAHYTDAYNKMYYCINDPFNYDPNNYYNPTATTPAPLMDQVDDTTSFVALCVERLIGERYGADSATFWDDNPLANNVIFEFQIPQGRMLAYLDIWGRKNKALDDRNKKLIIELYNDYGSSISTKTFSMSASDAEYPTFARVDLSAMGFEPAMLTLASGVRVRHQTRHVDDDKNQGDFLHVMELRMSTSAMLEEIKITGAKGGTPNYPAWNDLPKYLYNDAFVYNPLSPLSDQPDLTWKHPTDSNKYSPGLDTALFAVKKGLDNSWLEIDFELASGQRLSCIDLWTDERDNQPSYRYKSLVITLKDSVNGTSWSSPEWSGISHPSHYGRYTFPLDVPNDLLYKATSVHIYNKHGDQELLVIFEARLAGFSRKNTKPVADAGPQQFVTWNDTVTLDATQTVDPDWYQTLEYLWVAPGINLQNASTATPHFVAPLVRDTTVLSFMLRVSDGEVDASPVFAKVTVYPPANKKPVAMAGDDTTMVSGETVTLSASGSYDLDSMFSMSYLWRSLDQLPLDDASAQTFEFTAPDVVDTTVYGFELIVDDSISSSHADTVWVTVVPKATRITTPQVKTVAVYPTVSHEGFNIQSLSGVTIDRLLVFNISGQLVWTSEPAMADFYLNADVLPTTGVYIVSLIQNNETSTIRIMKE